MKMRYGRSMKKQLNPLSMMNKQKFKIFKFLQNRLLKNARKFQYLLIQNKEVRKDESRRGKTNFEHHNKVYVFIQLFLPHFTVSFFISLHLSLLFFHPIPPIYPAKKSQYTSFIVSDAIIANESGEITVIKIDFFRPHFLLPSFFLSHNTQKLLACCLQPLLLFTLFKWHRNRKKMIFIALKMIFAIKLHSKK